MEEKITLNLFYMGLIAAILAMLFSGISFYDTYQTQVQEDLSQQGLLIAAAYDSCTAEDALPDYGESHLRVTLVAPDGSVLYENYADASAMENHLSRPEIIAALETGSGSAKRPSNTLGAEDRYYYAMRLSDGNILRVSQSVSSIYQIYGRAVPHLVTAIVFLMILAVVFAVLLTRRLLVPIKNLPAQLDDPALADDPKKVYPELRPFILEIQQQRQERVGMRQEFTANVSHELKTPLTSISGYAEMIENGLARQEDIPHFAGKIRQEASRMLTLISDIIRLSQLDEAETFQKAPVDLYALAEECIESLAPVARKKDVSLEVTGVPCTVAGDQRELWELLYNLVDNAIRYNRPGGSVHIELLPQGLRVEDTGIGIPPEHQNRIFERFYRVDKSHSRQTGGTGLGLSIVKHVAEHHGAKLELHSIVGVGTEISVIFPEM